MAAATTVAISKLEARILFDRLVLSPEDELSHAVCLILRVHLRDEPDERAGRLAPLAVSERQCYRILNTIRDSYANEAARGLADKLLDALLELETRASVDDLLGGRSIRTGAPDDQPGRALRRDGRGDGQAA